MYSSRMMTIATFLLLFSSSSPAFPDDPAATRMLCAGLVQRPPR